MRRLLAASAMGAAVAALPTAASAQSIDYANMRQLFGEPVTTSATGAPRRATEVPVAMEIITAEQIRRMPATDLPGILQNVVGVDVVNSTMGSADINIHGYNQPYSPRLLVLINGRQVYLDHFSMTAWNTLPVTLDEIQQIEVVKGPNTALFGFNAVSGVVNIVTVNPLYDDRNTASVTVGTQEHRQGSASFSKKVTDRIGVRASVDGLRAREFSDGFQAREAGLEQDLERRTFAGEVLAQVTDDTQAGVEVTHADTNQTDFLPFPGLARANFQTTSVRGSVASNTEIGLIKAQVYRNMLNASVTAPMTGYVPLDNAVTVAQLEDTFKIGAEHTVRLSTEYRNNELDVTPNGNGAVVGYDVYAAGAMWDWAITPQVSLTNALRLDHLSSYRAGAAPLAGFTNDDFDKGRTTYGYNVGLVYRPTDADTIRLTTSRGIQVPSLIEMGYQQDFGGPVMSGNPYLRPTVVTNYELGYDRRIAELPALGRLSVFHQKSEDLKALPGLTPTPTFLFVNAGSSTATGLDASLRNLDGAPWRWRLGYSLVSVNDELTVNQGGTTVNPIDFENSTPLHQLKGNIGYTMGDWSYDLYGIYTAGTEQLREQSPGVITSERISPYLTLSARINYNLTDWSTLSLIGQDINQHSHREGTGLENERRVLLRASAGF